jgi:hypothetical protein
MKIRSGFVSNSSSSSFVCKTKMTVEEVEESLHQLLDFYNEFCGLNLEFDEVFKKPFFPDKNFVKEMNEGWSHLYNKYSEDKMVIESTDDNSIPYVLFDLIEEKFDAGRNHLG